MKRIEFSTQVPQFLPTKRNIIQQIIFELFQRADYERVQHMRVLLPDDVDSILKNIGLARTYLIDKSFIEEGIQYVVLELGGIKQEFREVKPYEVARQILIEYQHRWHTTRKINVAPFIPLLTSRKLILAVPVSEQGYSTLAKIQLEQYELAKEVLAIQSAEGDRLASAIKSMKNR